MTSGRAGTQKKLKALLVQWFCRVRAWSLQFALEARRQGAPGPVSAICRALGFEFRGCNAAGKACYRCLGAHILVLLSWIGTHASPGKIFMQSERRAILDFGNCIAWQNKLQITSTA